MALPQEDPRERLRRRARAAAGLGTPGNITLDDSTAAPAAIAEDPARERLRARAAATSGAAPAEGDPTKGTQWETDPYGAGSAAVRGASFTLSDKAMPALAAMVQRLGMDPERVRKVLTVALPGAIAPLVQRALPAATAPADKGKSYTELYTKLKAAQDASRAQYAGAHPVANFAAELGGGIASTIATAGLGEVAGGIAGPAVFGEDAYNAWRTARAAKQLAAAAKAKELAGTGGLAARAARTVLPKLYTAGKAGGQWGALTGAAGADWTDENNTFDLTSILGGAAKGGAIGVPAGIALSGLGQGIGGAVGAGARKAGLPAATSAAMARLAQRLPAGSAMRTQLERYSGAIGPKGAVAERVAPMVQADIEAGFPATAGEPQLGPAGVGLPLDEAGPHVLQYVQYLADKGAAAPLAKQLETRAASMRPHVTGSFQEATGQTAAQREALGLRLGTEQGNIRTATGLAKAAEKVNQAIARANKLVPKPTLPDPVAQLEALAGAPIEGAVPVRRATRATRSANAAVNYPAARAAETADIATPLTDALLDTPAGRIAHRRAQARTANEQIKALGQGVRAGAAPAPAPAALEAPPITPTAPAAPTLAGPTMARPSQLRPPAPGEIGGVTGKAGVSLTHDGQELPAEYMIVSARDLVPSHDPFSFEPNPRFPAGVQGRDYKGNKALQDVVTTRAAGYSPSAALDPSHSIGLGVPTVLPDGTVLAGTERTLLHRRASALHPDRMQAYQTRLREMAGEYGINPADIDKVADPMLVRVLRDPGDVQGGPARWAEINRLSDEVATKAKAASEQGAAHATKLAQSPLALTHLADTIQPDETLTQYLGTANGRAFVRHLTDAGVFTPAQLAGYSEGLAAGGGLTAEGKDAVTNMLLSAAMERPSVIGEAPKFMVNKLEHAVPSIVGTRGTPFDLSGYVTEALEIAAEARGQNMNVHELLAQHDLLGPSTSRDPFAVDLAKFLADNTGKRVKDAFRRFGKLAHETTARGESGVVGDLLGGADIQHDTPASAFRAAFGGPPTAEAAWRTPSPLALAPSAPPAAPVAPVRVAQPTTPPVAATGQPGPVTSPIPGRAAAPTLQVPPGMAPPPMPKAAAAIGYTEEKWLEGLARNQAEGRAIDWVPARTAAGPAQLAAPPARTFRDPQTMHYTKQELAKMARFGEHATAARGIENVWSGVRGELRQGNPLWAKADDVFAENSHPVEMADLGANLLRTHLNPASVKSALYKSLDALEAEKAKATPEGRAAFEAAAQGAFADYFRSGGSRVGVVRKLADPSSDMSRRVVLAFGDEGAPDRLRRSLLATARPQTPPVPVPPVPALSASAQAVQRGLGILRTPTAPAEGQLERSLPMLDAARGAMGAGERRGLQQGAAAAVGGGWEAMPQNVQSPGRFFNASPERARQVAYAFPTPDAAAGFQGDVAQFDKAAALRTYLFGNSATARRAAAAKLHGDRAISGEDLALALLSHSPKGLALAAGKSMLTGARGARESQLAAQTLEQLLTPGGAGRALEGAAARAQLQGATATGLRRLLGLSAGYGENDVRARANGGASSDAARLDVTAARSPAALPPTAALAPDTLPTGSYLKRGHPVIDTGRPDAGGHVPTHRLDLPSGRRAGESWTDYEDRVIGRTTFSPDTAHRSDLGALAAPVADSARTMMAAARAAGLQLTPAETRRSQERQEMLFQKGRKPGTGGTVTWTLTSDHAPGKAIDFTGSRDALEWLQQNAPRYGFYVLGAMDPGHVGVP